MPGRGPTDDPEPPPVRLLSFIRHWVSRRCGGVGGESGDDVGYEIADVAARGLLDRGGELRRGTAASAAAGAPHAMSVAVPRQGIRP